MKIKEQTKETIISVNLEFEQKELESIYNTMINLCAKDKDVIRREDIQAFNLAMINKLINKSPSNEFEEFIQMFNKIIVECKYKKEIII